LNFARLASKFLSLGWIAAVSVGNNHHSVFLENNALTEKRGLIAQYQEPTPSGRRPYLPDTPSLAMVVGVDAAPRVFDFELGTRPVRLQMY
jgi:hypothetical protein